MHERMGQLTDKTILVTGGASRLGRAVVEQLALAGARVVIASRNSVRNQATCEKLARQGLEVDHRQVDVSDERGVERCFSGLQEDLDRLDGVVCLANRARGGPSMAIASDDWDVAFSTIVRGSYICAAQAAQWMATTGGGSVVLCSSILALRSPAVAHWTRGDPAPDYAAAKGALISMAKFLAVSWGAHAIRVNTITPGAFSVEEAPAPVPLGRSGTGAELGGPIVFLCASASSYITGQNIIVDGGWSAKM